MVHILEYYMRETEILFHDHIDKVTIEFAKCKRDVAERYSTDVCGDPGLAVRNTRCVFTTIA